MKESTRKSMSSSASAHWCTPEKVLEPVRRVNEIALDPCSNAFSVVGAKTSISLPDNGLEAEWAEMALEAGGGLVFVNPPYGREIKSWVQKSVIESARGAEIVLLTAARTETKWFQTWGLATCQAVCFWKGRVTFIDGTGKKRSDPAFFPSALLYWGPNVHKFIEEFSHHGVVFPCNEKVY